MESKQVTNSIYLGTLKSVYLKSVKTDVKTAYQLLYADGHVRHLSRQFY